MTRTLIRFISTDHVGIVVVNPAYVTCVTADLDGSVIISVPNDSWRVDGTLDEVIDALNASVVELPSGVAAHLVRLHRKDLAEAKTLDEIAGDATGPRIAYVRGAADDARARAADIRGLLAQHGFSSTAKSLARFKAAQPRDAVADVLAAAMNADAAS